MGIPLNPPDLIIHSPEKFGYLGDDSPNLNYDYSEVEQ